MTPSADAMLIIVPCAATKIWSKYPDAGPTAARDAYVSGAFTVYKDLAWRFATRWVVLSAKYGFIDPDFIIPESYEVTFKRKRSGPIDVQTLQEQVLQQELNLFPRTVILGGIDYINIVLKAWPEAPRGILQAPFAGRTIGYQLQAMRNAIDRAEMPADDSAAYAGIEPSAEELAVFDEATGVDVSFPPSPEDGEEPKD